MHMNKYILCTCVLIFWNRLLILSRSLLAASRSFVACSNLNFIFSVCSVFDLYFCCNSRFSVSTPRSRLANFSDTDFISFMSSSSFLNSSWSFAFNFWAARTFSTSAVPPRFFPLPAVVRRWILLSKWGQPRLKLGFLKCLQ